MNKAFVDTNIVIDLLSSREPFYEDAAILFSLADHKKINLLISGLTIANTHYYLSKLKSPKEAKEIMRRFKLLVQILSLDDRIITLALNDDGFQDFEDGLQYYTAVENDLKVIISRNKRDFKNSKIPILSAKEYLLTL